MSENKFTRAQENSIYSIIKRFKEKLEVGLKSALVGLDLGANLNLAELIFRLSIEENLSLFFKVQTSKDFIVLRKSKVHSRYVLLVGRCNLG